MNNIGLSNGNQWSAKWVVGLVAAGLILFMGQKVITYDGRIQVLENEKTYLADRLDRIEQKVDRIEDKVNKIDRESKSQ